AAGGVLLASAWLMTRRARNVAISSAVIVSLLGVALWALLVAATGSDSMASGIAEALRNILMLVAVYRLFASDGRHRSVAPVRPVVCSLMLVELLVVALLTVEHD